MERIPRPGSRRVAFFQHGILDTSLTWVSSGVTGSQAFAAWDQGFDVWLGSSRSNPPRLAKDHSKQGLAYFSFSLNELGIQDTPAQLDHVHGVKMREILGSGFSSIEAVAAAAAAGSKGRKSQAAVVQTKEQPGVAVFGGTVGAGVEDPAPAQGASSERGSQALLQGDSSSLSPAAVLDVEYRDVNEPPTPEVLESPLKRRGAAPERESILMPHAAAAVAVAATTVVPRQDVPEVVRADARGNSGCCCGSICGSGAGRLGGMSMLVYCVMRAAAGLPHHVDRLILMSPAGYHRVIPTLFWPFVLVLPWWHKLLQLCLGDSRAYHPAVLPTYIGRAVAFSYLLEIARLPALADFTRALMKVFFGGDASEWERALLMPHYSAAGMPACSLHQALHFIQIIHSGRFQLFDYGSPAANIARYGSPKPPDIGSQYWRLAGLSVDLLAGSGDGVIPPANVRCHYRQMQSQGLQVTYREFAYGHMDFTFSMKDELRYYVMQCLNRK
eukprot:gene3459-3730_t